MELLRGGNEAKGAGANTSANVFAPALLRPPRSLQLDIEMLRCVFEDGADAGRVERVADRSTASLCWGEVTVNEAKVFEVS